MKRNNFVLPTIIMLIAGTALAQNSSSSSSYRRKPTFTPSTYLDIGAWLTMPGPSRGTTRSNGISDSQEALFATYSFNNAGTTYNVEFYYREQYSRIRTRVLKGEQEMRGLLNRFYGVDVNRRAMLSVYGSAGVPEVRLNFGRFSLNESKCDTDAIYDISEEYYAQSFPTRRNVGITISHPPGMLKKTYLASLDRFYLISEEGHVDPFTRDNLRRAYNREDIRAESQADMERIGRSLIQAWDTPNSSKMLFISGVNEIPKYSLHPLDSENEKKVAPPRHFRDNGTDYYVCCTYRQHVGVVFRYKVGFQAEKLSSIEEVVLGRSIGDYHRVLSPGAYVKRPAVTPTSKYITPTRNRTAEGGTIERIRTLVASGVDVNTRQRFGYAPLHFAAWHGERKMVELLIDKGAAVNAATWLGDTPLHLACERHRIEIAKLLISKGADVNAQGNYGRTALHHAARLGNKELVSLLLASGANVNAQEEDGYTPLHGAAYENFTDVAKILVSNGADIDGGSNAHPPLYWTVQRDHKEMVQFLMASGANSNGNDGQGKTILHEAATFGAIGAAKVLLDNGADMNARDGRGNTPLGAAIFWGHEKLAELFISRGADIAAKNRNGEAALRGAVSRGTPAMAELLISAGADINTRDKWGKTSLHEAAEDNKKEMVKLLLAHGADVRIKDKSGKTPLDLAAEKNRAEIIELLHAANGTSLLERKADKK